MQIENAENDGKKHGCPVFSDEIFIFLQETIVPPIGSTMDNRNCVLTDA